MTLTVAVVTGTRADYGLLRWLMEELRDRENVALRTIVTGSHLSPAFGSTVDAITADDFTVDERVEILSDDDSPLGTAAAMARATEGLAVAFSRTAPDLVVVLGDRYEILAAAQAALVLGIPVAHIAGGELTEGAIDDAIRHAVTKLSRLHFPAAEDYRRRIIQMGEDPAQVWNVGATGLDNFVRLELLDRAALAESLGISLGTGPLGVCTFHPETLDRQSPADALRPLLDALTARPELQVIFTMANADPGGRAINAVLEQFTAERDASWLFASLGQVRYLSLLREADVVIGNSSSGIIEAPAAGTPTVNIGERQTGRLRAASIIDVPNDTVAIGEALDRALSPEFQELAARRESPYGQPGAAQRMADVIAAVDLERLHTKKFHDRGGEDER